MSAPVLWTIDDMARAMHAQRQGALPQAISGISIDSRSIAPGEAFFAITGDNRDGHDFVDCRAEGRSRACGRVRRTPRGISGGRAASDRARCARRLCATSPWLRVRASKAR